MTARPLLFDADGVLAVPDEVFTTTYARSRGLDPGPFAEFFRTEWPDIVTGRRDLKEAIASTPELWRWPGTPEELLDHWFRTEDVRNDELLDVIAQLRARGVPAYLATDQERYRGEYLRDTMFRDAFDGYFISAELGVTKSEPAFFELVIDELTRRHPGLEPGDITFFDDNRSKVETAESVGISARLFEHTDQVRALLPAGPDRGPQS